MKPEQMWFYEKEAKPIFTPTHEILYGLHLASTYGKPTKKEFGTFEQLEQAYKDKKVEFDDIVMLDDRKNSYGRAKIEHILNMDLDAGLGEDEPITVKNINKIISAMSSHRYRARELHELTEFATEIISYVGMDTPPFEQMYDKDDPEIKKIIESQEPVSVKYTKLNNYISKYIMDKVNSLEGSSLPSMLKGSGRVKASQLEEIYSPAIYIDKNDVTISNRTLFEGQTERDFVTKGIDNRKIQQIKREGVPVGGYAERQLVLAQMDYLFKDEKASPDKIGLEIPLSEASGRTRLSGTVISDDVARKANKTDRVKVKSCINHREKVIYADEIDQRDLREKDGAAIGVSFAMALTEAKTQSILGLKHGGIKREFEDDRILAYRSGTVKSFDSEFMFIETSEGFTDKYLMCEKTVPTVKFGQYVQKGDEIAASNRLKQVHDQLADFEAFIGINNIHDSGLTRERERGLVIRYAPCDGTIKYPDANTVQIGEIRFNTNRKELYYYPEGYSVKTGESICSGVLDMQYFMYLNHNDQQCFDAFKKQMLDTYPNQQLRSEIYEVTFKVLRDEFNAHKTFTNTDNFINRLYAGDTKQGLKRFFNESGEDNVIRIKDSLILPIVLGFDTKEENEA